MTIAPPCSAALPTSATITTATKNCERPSALAEALQRVDEELGDERGRGRGGGEGRERAAEAPGAARSARCAASRRCSAQVAGGRRRRRAEQHRRDRQRQQVEAWRSGSPCKPGIAGMRKSADRGDQHAPSWTSSERRRAGPPPPASIAPPQTSSEVETTEPVIEPQHDARQAVADREERDDQLGRVAEAGVDEARRSPGPVCRARFSVASPIRKASGASAAAASTKTTRAVGVEAVAGDEHDRA